MRECMISSCWRWLEVLRGVSCQGWRRQLMRLVTFSFGLSPPSAFCPRWFSYSCSRLSFSELSDCPFPSCLPTFPFASLFPPFLGVCTVCSVLLWYIFLATVIPHSCNPLSHQEMHVYRIHRSWLKSQCCVFRHGFDVLVQWQRCKRSQRIELSFCVDKFLLYHSLSM